MIEIKQGVGLDLQYVNRLLRKWVAKLNLYQVLILEQQLAFIFRHNLMIPI